MIFVLLESGLVVWLMGWQLVAGILGICSLVVGVIYLSISLDTHRNTV